MKKYFVIRTFDEMSPNRPWQYIWLRNKEVWITANINDAVRFDTQEEAEHAFEFDFASYTGSIRHWEIVKILEAY